MVRAVVGTLLEVGRGKRTVADFAALVLPPSFAGLTGESPDAGSQSGMTMRSLAGESVPGHALFLSEIRY